MNKETDILQKWMFAQVIFDNNFVISNTTPYCLRRKFVRCLEKSRKWHECLAWCLCECMRAHNRTVWMYSSHSIEMCHPTSHNNWKRLCIRSYFTQRNNFVTSHSPAHGATQFSMRTWWGNAEVKRVLCQLRSIINWICVCVICKNHRQCIKTWRWWSEIWCCFGCFVYQLQNTIKWIS